MIPSLWRGRFPHCGEDDSKRQTALWRRFQTTDLIVKSWRCFILKIRWTLGKTWLIITGNKLLGISRHLRITPRRVSRFLGNSKGLFNFISFRNFEITDSDWQKNYELTQQVADWHELGQWFTRFEKCEEHVNIWEIIFWEIRWSWFCRKHDKTPESFLLLRALQWGVSLSNFMMNWEKPFGRRTKLILQGIGEPVTQDVPWLHQDKARALCHVHFMTVFGCLQWMIFWWLLTRDDEFFFGVFLALVSLEKFPDDELCPNFELLLQLYSATTSKRQF